LPAIRLHDLRHTNASLALGTGIDIKVVSDRLEHSTMAVTLSTPTSSRLSVETAAKRIAGLLGTGRKRMPTRCVREAQRWPERRGPCIATGRWSAPEGVLVQDIPESCRRDPPRPTAPSHAAPPLREEGVGPKRTINGKAEYPRLSILNV
jgi:hypothetical protein